ncbi:MAG: ATP-binding protein [Chitinophagaceae bacterium]
MKSQFENIFSFSESEERIDKLVNGLRVGVLLQGPQAEILFSNKAALNMLGLTEDELYGKSSFNPEWNVIHEDGSVFPGTEQPVPMVIKTKKTVANVVMGVYRPSSMDRIWLLVNAEPLFDERGDVKEVICSFSDITERKAVEEKLTWLYQSLEIRAFELATSNADLERFLYIATHDLQEPLRLVSSFTQLLKKKYERQLDPQAIEYINYAVEGATRMKKLILDLLEYSKFSTSNKEFSDTDMNVVLENVCKLFSNELENCGAQLLIPDLPVITANGSMMTQLFENFISNALKYRSAKKPVIKIECKEDGDNFLFGISDNGVGIAPEYSDKIFALFKRLHRNNEIEGGTGVGLAICKKIVELHRGNIWVVSEQGKGSKFYFTVARKQNQTHEKV